MNKLNWFYNMARRTILFFIVAGVFAFVTHAGLKDLAAEAYLNIGTAVGQDPSRVSFDDILRDEFNMLVCENAMKFSSTERSEGNFSFGGGDALVEFAEENDMLVRGHTLVWHSQTSSWIQNYNRDRMLEAMESHINGLLDHWNGKILEWDVVNEAVSDNGRELRGSFWSNTIGDEFIDSAFVYAHRADPKALLYYNDYGADGINGKSDYTYEMVKGMLERGIPIHGIGLQSHLSSNLRASSISDNIKRYGELGLRVSLTEIDITGTANNGAPWGDLMEACLENFNCTSFMTWGVHDGISWLRDRCNGCLIWQSDNNVHQATYDALEKALKNADPEISEKRLEFISDGVGAKERMSFRKNQKPQVNFNGRLLSYTLQADQAVQLSVFDTQGKQVADLNLGMKTSGLHTVEWAKQQLPTGLYFAQITLGSQKLSIPFTLLQN